MNLSRYIIDCVYKIVQNFLLEKMKKLILRNVAILLTIRAYAQNYTIVCNDGRDSSNIDRERKMENFNGK